MDENNECIFCQDETIDSPLVNYEHNCGKYLIHQKCLDNWFLKNNQSCIICRNNILSSDESISDDISNDSSYDTSYDTSYESSYDSEYQSVSFNNETILVSDPEENNNICDISNILCFVNFLFILIIFLLIIYFIIAII